MIGNLIFIAYWIGYVVAWPLCYREFYRQMNMGLEWDGVDRSFGVVCSSVAAIFWPLIVVVFYFRKGIVAFLKTLEVE